MFLRPTMPVLLVAFLASAGVAAALQDDAPAIDDASAIDDGPAIKEKPLFTSDEVLELSLAVDFDALCRPNEDEDCQYSPSTLVYRPAAGKERDIPVEIRVRGGWRARKDHCEVPPLFVRFPDQGVAGTPFVGENLLPLTTHCRSNKSRKLGSASPRQYEQYLLREYLGYRLYNMVSNKSLRVRLVRITYENPAPGGKTLTRYAFFTEHFDDMAARYDARALYTKDFDYRRIDLPSMDEVAVFNYMIGNTDWSIVRQRNIVLIVTGDGRQYPVPFDLDMSGLVYAEYAGVSPRLDFRDVRQRYYLGFCHPQAQLEELFALYRKRKDELLDLVGDIPGSDRSSKKQSRAFLKKFFYIIESPERSREDIVEACHPWPPAAEDHTTPPEET